MRGCRSLVAWIAMFAACGNPYVLNGFRSPMGVNGMRARPHAGVDFAGELGDPVIAAAAGDVLTIVDDPIAGVSILIQHGVGRYTVYLHLSEVEVVPGQCVMRGQEIGKVGATGKGAGGRTHVHLELCTRLCPSGHADGDLADVEDPLANGAECFDPERRYKRSTLTYPIVCRRREGIPVPADLQRCRRQALHERELELEQKHEIVIPHH